MRMIQFISLGMDKNASRLDILAREVSCKIWTVFVLFRTIVLGESRFIEILEPGNG